MERELADFISTAPLHDTHEHLFSEAQSWPERTVCARTVCRPGTCATCCSLSSYAIRADAYRLSIRR
jgi:hypothetical protein